MPTSFRLDRETECLLEKTAKALRASKSEVIKRSLREYCPSVLHERSTHPYQLIEDLLHIDRAGSGRGDLSVRGEEILREMFGRRE